MRSEQIIIIVSFSISTFLPYFECNSTIKAIKAELVKKHLKRLKKEEGAIKLVGGRQEYEGRFLFTLVYALYNKSAYIFNKYYLKKSLLSTN